MTEAIKKGNKAGRGPGYPVPKSGSSNLPQHGGEGKHLKPKTDIKFAKSDAGPGRYL